MASRSPRRVARVVTVGGLLVALAFVAAGCGSAKKTISTTGTTQGAAQGAAPGGTQSAAFQAFQTCLKQHGITTFGFGRRPNGGGTGTTGTGTTGGATGQRPAGGFRRNLSPAQQKAFTACRSKLPAGRFGPGGGFGGPRGGGGAGGAFAKYTACLKAHGVTFGSASSSGKAFQKASAACAKLRPSFNGGAGAPPGATTPATTTNATS